MPQLISPDVRVHASFLEAMAEFRADGRGAPADTSFVGLSLRDHGSVWHDPETFSVYTAMLCADALDETPRAEGSVPCTHLWYVEDTTYLGRVGIRHSLSPWLLEFGGHIGYDVRPSVRRRGHATAMLRAALPVVRALGAESVLVTCDTDNAGSRKVIETCGGVLEDERGGKLRFWIPSATGG